jgi:enoyl-CoA hydratase/carnithine racemase
MSISPTQLKVSRQGSTALWAISNPTAKNALSFEAYQQGIGAIKALEADQTLACAVLYGEAGFFCSGGNLNRLLNNRSLPPQVQSDSIDGLHAWIAALHACKKPIIAAVDGAAAGAGFSLALACDLIIASPSAKFVMAYVNVGLTPDGGASKALSDRLPAQLAFEVCALGKPILGQRLYELGIVNQLCTDPNSSQTEPAVAMALEWGESLSHKPPKALSNIKQLISQARSTPYSAHFINERSSFVEQLHSNEALIGITAFLKREKPKFR